MNKFVTKGFCLTFCEHKILIACTVHTEKELNSKDKGAL